MSNKLFFIIIGVLLAIIFFHSLWVLMKTELPPADEYGFLVATPSGDYVAKDIVFHEGYIVLEDYYKVYGDRGDHHTNTLLLSGDKITITSRVAEGE